MLRATFVIFILSVVSLRAEIIETHSFKSVLKRLESVDSKTLVCFDIDETLIIPKDPSFHYINMNEHRELLEELFLSSTNEEVGLFKDYLVHKHETILVEHISPRLLKGLARKKAQVMGLLKIQKEPPGLSSEYYEELKVHGLDFSGISKQIPTSDPEFKQGVLYVREPKVNQGAYFCSFLSKLEKQPKWVIVIDDSMENLQAIESSLKETDMKFLGIHYLGAQEYPSLKISKPVFRRSCRKLMQCVKQALETKEGS